MYTNTFLPSSSWRRRPDRQTGGTGLILQAQITPVTLRASESIVTLSGHTMTIRGSGDATATVSVNPDGRSS
jgi:hypothetical protein